ncbi:MAG: hypothetical protein J1G05_01945 [Clostridiales bacterium]|nr:hypothetical protein [Clostridiales bacterium]
MKKTKLLLSTLVSFLLAFVMVFAVACNDGGNTGNTNNNVDHGITDSSKDGLALDHISVSGYTKTFTLGTAFSTGNLVVTATLNDYSISDKYTTDVELNAGEYVVDSSDYNANRVGVYTIYVSHTRSNVTRTAHYTVEVTPVTPAYGGIVVALAEGKQDTFTLTETDKSATVAKDTVAVYLVDADGEPAEEALHEDQYDADLYLGSAKIENNTTDIGGVYSLVVTLKADTTNQDFIPIYIVNPVTDIELANADTAETEQEASSKDEISGTWEFTVTYSNGTTKTVKAGDEGLTIEIDTKTAGENKTANVKYVEADAKGTEHEAATTVTYTITAKVIEGDTITYTITGVVNLTEPNWSNSYSEDPGEDINSTVDIEFTGGVTTGEHKKSATDGTELTNHLDLNATGKSIKITVGAGATNVNIKAYVSHSSTNNNRSAYLGATCFDTESYIDTIAMGGDSGNAVSGTLYVLEADNATPGTYYVYGNATVHIYAVEVVYTVASSTGGDEISTDPVAIKFDGLTAGDYYGATADGVTENMGDIGTITIPEKSLVEALEIVHTTKDKLSIKSVNETITDGNETYTLTKSFSTQGGSTTARRVIKLTLASSHSYTIKVWAKTTSNNRYVQYLNAASGDFTKCTTAVGNGSVNKHEFTANGGTLFIGGDNNIDIYLIVIELAD